MKKILCFFTTLGISLLGFSQELNLGEVHGDFNLNLQSYQEDKLIGAKAADEIILNNAYLNLNYLKGNFATGIRYESYLNALADYDPDFKGNGIPYMYATYNIDGLEVTAGNYYEQLGSGLIFRSYEEKGLGIDNAMDGVRVKYSPLKGIYLKSFIGKSRTYFTYADGIFRGADGELNINDVFNLKSKTKAIIGGSFISRYQKRENVMFKIPQNVAAYASRLNIIRGNWSYYSEFAYKLNDPANLLNKSKMNYAPGSALTNNISFSKKGFGLSAEIHRIDNMTFKSDRDRNGKAYIINYIPTLSKPHSYALLAMYPYATQSDGEIAIQVDLFLKFKKGSMLGGKYGTKLDLNYSRMNALSGDYGKSFLNDEVDYTPIPLCFAQERYFQDMNLEINKKINKKIKTTCIIANQTYNKDFIEGKPTGDYGVINSTILVADISYKIKNGHSIRTELQRLGSIQLESAKKLAEGDWSMGLLEYTISPNWFFQIQDMYNWGNEDVNKQLHYVNINAGFMKGANRFEVGYGKKREGIFCVGGVCKTVPSSNGFNLSITSSF
ncbi:MAG: hypothetical protein CMD16_02075 [Flavobacteriales bacterium]|nr:hypothetical protein [Flavobacteriales bacterium]|tara:strand:+ start:89402 stop:91063 length:1662 start_codon:yes stop_codon:yes gene_type:complete